MGRPAILKIDILADGKDARSEFDRTSKASGKLGSALKAGAAIGVAAVGALAVAAGKAASDVEQAVGASEKVFGKYAKSVQDNAAKADRALGLSKSSYLDLANLIGTQLKNAGTPMDELNAKTDGLIRQGADLAATFGGSTADAVAALSSAMKGELDPIEKFGVSLKKSDVNARLAAKGQDKLTGTALKAAEQQALLALITEQSASSQGAFADESDTAAGVGARAAAVWENFKATLGEGLLPILVAVGSFFLDTLAPAVSRLSEQFSANLGPTLEKARSVFADRVVPAAKLLYSWFMDKIVPGLRKAVQPVIESMQRRFDKMRDAIERNRPAIDKVLKVLKVVAEFIAQKVAPVVGTILGKAFDVGTAAITATIDVIGWLVDKIAAAVGWFKRLKDGIDDIADRFNNSTVGKVLSGDFGGIFGSAVTVRGVAARPDGLTGAAGLPSSSQLVRQSVNVAAPQVSVFIGEREVTDIVRVEVADANRRQARRLALMPIGG